MKILHLEDNSDDAELVAWELRKSIPSVVIRVVSNRIDYQRALREFMPAIVISDHALLSFDSQEALEILQEAGLDIPFIIVTGSVPEKLSAAIIGQGATAYILKGHLHQLGQAIHSALEKKSSR